MKIVKLLIILILLSASVIYAKDVTNYASKVFQFKSHMLSGGPLETYINGKSVLAVSLLRKN